MSVGLLRNPSFLVYAEFIILTLLTTSSKPEYHFYLFKIELDTICRVQTLT